ncbi:MAG TPA: hypothetical protein VLC98_06350 [Phnomibacter sp.]|nr:hypothetical protein [Phnomibacter sp.]
MDSIYDDLNGVDLNHFEVIVSDNEANATSKELVSTYKYDNLHYHETNCEGFLNSFYALKYGRGFLLKLHNNYTMLKPKTLQYLINEAKENVGLNPVIFYTDGLNGKVGVSTFRTFDDFMFNLSYFSSWSTGFSIWKASFDEIESSLLINNYFPQTSLLLSLSDEKRFVMNNLTLFNNQNIPKKGGYNIFKVFAVDYVDLLKSAFEKKKISQKTFQKIKSDLITKYLSMRFFKTVIVGIDNFEKADIEKNIRVNYSKAAYYKMILFSFIVPIKYALQRMKLRGANKISAF